ncbi:hypothetical protein NADE_001683 [Nannochloris sp. 'desiccata']|nr:hypothetical protein KSW81_001461 [Chlorella desiccata (nom. nud.)]KAH7616876.1 hypothetical protein NADE_001683 [Chlorella desiccata (nom. nud.)]
MASSSSEIEEPTSDGFTYLAQAETHITNNKFLEALTSLRSAQPYIRQEGDEFLTPFDVHRYMQLQALCRIELASTSAINSSNSLDTWWHVFGLETQDPSSSIPIWETTTTTAAATMPTVVKDVKRQYKRLAMLIHPDKCSLHCAQDIFKKLQQGMEALVESLECSEKAKKKVKQNEDDEEEEEKFSKEEEEFAWWTTWDSPYADGISSDTAAEDMEAQQKREQEDKDIAFLSGLDSQQLAKEVRVRQDAILSRPPPGCTIQDMKTTLLRARKILNAKIEEEKKELQDKGGGVGGGGFLLR